MYHKAERKANRKTSSLMNSFCVSVIETPCDYKTCNYMRNFHAQLYEKFPENF